MTEPAPIAMELITCERGLGRLQASSCAKRWRMGNCAPASLRPPERMGAAGIRNSPCRACPHGEARSAAGEHKTKGPLVQLSDVAIIAPRQHERVRSEIEQRLSAPTKPPAPAPPAAKREPMAALNGRRCAICSAVLAGRSKQACAGEHQAEYYRRKSLENYYLKHGDAEAARAAMRGERPSERGAAATPAVPKAIAPPPDPSFANLSKLPDDEHAMQEAVAAEPSAIDPFAYTVRVRGLPVRCRTLQDVIALVERYGAQKDSGLG